MQNIITYAILALVALLVIKYVVQIIRKPKEKTPPTCSGCPLSETCNKESTENPKGQGL